MTWGDLGARPRYLESLGGGLGSEIVYSLIRFATIHLLELCMLQAIQKFEFVLKNLQSDNYYSRVTVRTRVTPNVRG